MPMPTESPEPSAEADRLVNIARHAEQLSEHDDVESFPEEGTDDKLVQPQDTEATPITEQDAVRATQAVIDAGLARPSPCGRRED